MALGLGSAAIIGGLGLLGSLGGTAIQYGANSALQNDQQEFNAEQAEISRNFNAEQAEISRNWSADQAQLNRDFQERMSSTAYQRAVSDMKAAGINPAFLSGSGAGTPSGSMANSALANSATAGSSSSGISSPANMFNMFANAAMRVISDNDSNKFKFGNAFAKQAENFFDDPNVIDASKYDNDPGYYDDI